MSGSGLVRLQWPIPTRGGLLDRVLIRPGAGDLAISVATGLRPDQVSKLFHDDRVAILKELAR